MPRPTKSESKKSNTLSSPSPFDPTVHYTEDGSAVNGSVAVLAGVGKDIAETVLHSGASQAVIGTLADFEDEDGLTPAEKAPAGWASGKREAIASKKQGGRPPSEKKYIDAAVGIDSYTTDEFGCWIWAGSMKAGVPTYRRRSVRRLMWFREKGQRADPERFLHSACREPACINPDHAIWFGGAKLPAEYLRLDIRFGHTSTE